jgi:butyrate kinase
VTERVSGITSGAGVLAFCVGLLIVPHASSCRQVASDTEGQSIHVNHTTDGVGQRQQAIHKMTQGVCDCVELPIVPHLSTCKAVTSDTEGQSIHVNYTTDGVGQ